METAAWRRVIDEFDMAALLGIIKYNYQTADSD